MLEESARKRFLSTSDCVDCDNEQVVALGRALSAQGDSTATTAQACFVYVRDEIDHCCDYRRDTIVSRASKVLEHKTGFCFAKAHLLVALLRVNGIPSAFCYQRLRFEAGKPDFCLHGLAAVYLDEFGWYRIDPRGNKPGVNAQFTPPAEQLAFPIAEDEERDIAELWAQPRREIVEWLDGATNLQQAIETLPDESRPLSTLPTGTDPADYTLML